MSEELVSIIIPVYNCRKYLTKCIKSIRAQTFTNLEIILVDDGSRDGSGYLCDKMAAIDPRITVFHKENSGVSATRNYGIDIANGKYITFVDADDWLPLNAIELLYNRISQDEADLSYGSTEIIMDYRNKKILSGEESIGKQNNGKEWVAFIKKVAPGVLGKLYRRSILIDNAIRFPLGIKAGEDTQFFMDYLKISNRISTISDVVYYYNQINMSSATRKYYEDYNEWMLKCIKKYRDVVQTINCSQTEKESTIEVIALRYGDWMCRHYIEFSGKNQKTAMDLIEDAIDKIHPFFQAAELYGHNYSDVQLAIYSKIMDDSIPVEKIYQIIDKTVHYKYKTLKNEIKRVFGIFKYLFYYVFAI